MLKREYGSSGSVVSGCRRARCQSQRPSRPLGLGGVLGIVSQSGRIAWPNTWTGRTLAETGHRPAYKSQRLAMSRQSSSAFCPFIQSSFYVSDSQHVRRCGQFCMLQTLRKARRSRHRFTSGCCRRQTVRKCRCEDDIPADSYRPRPTAYGSPFLRGAGSLHARLV